MQLSVDGDRGSDQVHRPTARNAGHATATASRPVVHRASSASSSSPPAAAARYQSLSDGPAGMSALARWFTAHPGRPVNAMHDARCVTDTVAGKTKNPKSGKF